MTPGRRGRPGAPPGARAAGPARPGALRALLVLLGVGLVGLVGALPATAAPADPAGSAARTAPAPRVDPVTPSGPVTLTLDTLAPRVVTADGPRDLVVAGRIRNTGTVPVGELGIRVQRGPGLTGPADVERALGGADPAQLVRPAFTDLPGVLAPGAEAPVQLRVPLVGSDPRSLALDAAGVYPLIVNINGAPAGGTPIRVAAERFLLPVIAPPPLPGARPGTTPATPPERVSVLYPLVDRPRRLPTTPGAPAVLADDDLATSFAPGGRLDGLVRGLDGGAPRGSPAAASVCVAVDADLLETARAMADGYRVSRPGGSDPGRGQAAAAGWLERTRAVLAGRCVVAVPYADADLLATSRGNLSDLTTYARTSAERRVSELLGVTPLPGATWPADGRLDGRTLSDLATGGARTVVVDADGLDTPSELPRGTPVALAGSPGATVLGVPTDPLTARALTGGSVRDAQGASPAGTDQPLALQDAVAALTLRAGEGSGTTLLAPPLRWSPSADEARALLGAVDGLARGGRATPVDLATVVAAAPAASAPPASLTDPDTPARAVDDPAVTRARTIRDQQRDLLAASEQDAPGSVTPADFVDPLTGDLLRGFSAVLRSDPAARVAAIDAVGAEMDALRSSVRVVQPSGSYSLGSNDAPLLLTVENRLPVAVDVAVVLDPTPGLQTSPLPVQVVPAYGSRQFQVGVRVTRAGQFSVDARALTPGGEALGPPSRLLLRSTAYGTITVWLTASAAVLLVILASIRIVRRIRAARRTPPTDGSGPGTGGLPARELQHR